MPFVSREELDQQANLLHAAQDTENHLRAGLEVARAAGAIVASTEAIIQRYMQNGSVLEQATQMARFDVENAERERVTKKLEEDIKRERGAEFAANFRRDHTAQIAAGLREQFKTDGTFSELERDAESEVRRDIEAEVLAEEKAKIDAELATPEAKAALREKIRAELVAGKGLDKYRRKAAEDLEEQWRKDVEAEERAKVEAEEEAREQPYKDGIRPGIAGSYQITERRSRIRSELERKWNSATTDEIIASLSAAELAAVLAAKAKKEADELTANEAAVKKEKYKEQFEGSGIPTETIPANTKLTIYLGAVTTVKAKVQNMHGYEETKNVPGVDCRRTLRLFALDGKGRFRVDYDSLNESDSVYEFNDAIPRSTIIVIGHNVKENGKESFTQLLSSESVFVYDDDTTNDNVISAQLPVSEIEIDGVAIRGLPVVPRAK